jgi:hypothetical protein
MKKQKTILSVLLGVIVGIVATLAAMRITPEIAAYFGPPHVTLMNASGEEMSDIIISLGQAKRDIPILKHHHSMTVPVNGGFSECSTHVEWTDSTGRHSESAGDYMESYGFYHARIIITPDRKATPVYDITERKSNK